MLTSGGYISFSTPLVGTELKSHWGILPARLGLAMWDRNLERGTTMYLLDMLSLRPLRTSPTLGLGLVENGR